MWLLAVFAMTGPSVNAQAVKWSCTFDDFEAGSDGSPLWFPQTHDWVIRDGTYQHTQPARTASITWLKAPVWADFELRLRFLIMDVGRGVRAPGLVFRSQDSATHYYVHYDSKNAQVILVRSDPVQPWNELKRVRGVNITPGEWHTAGVTCQGQHITVFLDNRVITEADDATLKAGLIGLRAGQGHILFDDLQVTGTVGNLAKEWTFLAQSKLNDDLDRPRLSSAERVVAVRGGGYFPVLIKLQDGSLGAVVRGGAPHIGIKGRLDWIRSTDGGKTWSAPSVIVDSQWDDRNPAVGQMADGTIIVAYAEAQTYNAQGQWDTTAGEFIQFYVTSKDNGASWSEKKLLYSGAIRGGSPFGRIITLSDGTALLSMYGSRDPAWKGEPTEEEVKGSTMSAYVISRDNGETWEDFTVVAPTGHNEMTLLALSDERLIAMCRTVSGAVNQFDSTDGGKTWHGPKPVTQASQHPPDVQRLSSGRLLLVWGNRREPLGVGSAISEDEGATWDYEHRVQLAWTSNNGDCGYPSLVQLEDGTIVMLYYSVGTEEFGPDELCIAVRFTEEQYLQAMGR
ncbi:MAG: sialidase family protein [Candidatus Zipacnadales bacterium]